MKKLPLSDLKKPEPIIVVGTGDYYHTILGPSLLKLQAEGLATIIATVSRSVGGSIPGIAHRVRAPGKSLSALLSDMKHQDPIVILGHANDLHVSDAQNLLVNGFRVCVEKPYAITITELVAMSALLKKYAGRVVLLEYYVMMKSIPLLTLCGQVRRNSFYFTTPDILKSHMPLHTPVALAGKIRALIGKPLSVTVELLEGKGSTGVLEHRGASLADIQRGGGMLQDLGIHAMAPFFAMEQYLGRIDPTFKNGVVRTARCTEYLRAMKTLLRLPTQRLGETYAEIKCATSKGIPVTVAVGKYLPRHTNQRQIVIRGSKGTLHFDLSSCMLYLALPGQPKKPILEAPKLATTKYYPVMRAALETLHGNNTFSFNPTVVALHAQKFILHVIKKCRADSSARNSTYRKGAAPYTVFKTHL